MANTTNPRRNAEGYSDPTAYEALKNIEREEDERFHNSQVNYAFVGGHWGDGLLVGPFYADLSTAASYSNSRFGAALSCKPLAAA